MMPQFIYTIKDRFIDWPNMLKFLYVLIVFDGLATYYGLKLNMIIEFNPLMDVAFSWSPIITLILKFVFSVFLLDIMHKIGKGKVLKYSINFLVLVHILITGLHLHWMTILFRIYRL